MSAVVELAAPPSLGRLYARGVVGSARAAASRGTGATRPDDLPSTRLVLPGVRADRDHLLAYQQVVNEPVSDALPAGFVHVLTFPVATALMVRPDFPLPLLGMVHLANRVEQRRTTRADEALDLTVHAENLRAHRKGAAVDVVAEAAIDDEVVWRGVSTYLAKGVRVEGARVEGAQGEGGQAEGRQDDGGTATGAGRAEFRPPVPTGRWVLDARVGRRYASVSGDHNPIHTSSLAARAFGFPRRIAHGMYTAARALADVGPARGDAFSWEVEFAAPVLLPSTVSVRVAADDDAAGGGSGHGSGGDDSGGASGFAFTAWSRKRHLSGAVRPLP